MIGFSLIPFVFLVESNFSDSEKNIVYYVPPMINLVMDYRERDRFVYQHHCPGCSPSISYNMDDDRIISGFILCSFLLK